MARLHEYLNEALGITLNESFGSSKIAEYMEKTKKKNSWIKQYLVTLFQWDKITDEDIKVLDKADAAKLAYKKNSNEDDFFLWITGDGIITAYSNGLIVYSDYGMFKSVRALSKSPAIKEAIQIKNYQAFETQTLRNQRREQKANALALKSDLEVAKENKERYEKLKLQNEVNKYGANNDIHKTIEAWMDALTTVYQTMIEDILESEDFKANYMSGSLFGRPSEQLKKINNDYLDILMKVENASWIEKRYNINEFNKEVKKLKSAIENFCFKYELGDITK